MDFMLENGGFHTNERDDLSSEMKFSGLHETQSIGFLSLFLCVQWKGIVFRGNSAVFSIEIPSKNGDL